MSEKKQQYKAFLKFGLVFLCAALYAMGGSEAFGGMKFLRRFIAPAVMAGGCFAFSRDWRYLAAMPFMFLSLSLGYGADIELWKVIKRGVFGLANGITSSGAQILRKKWLLLGLQTAILVLAYVALGVWNPMPDSRVEEFVLGVFVFLIPVMSA